MGPQLYRCGNAGGMMTCFPPCSCFNGAATLSLRKCEAYLLRSGGTELLQWGRNFIVAEISTFLAESWEDALLQWGRNFIVAEICTVHEMHGLIRDASMGPQLYRCGNQVLGSDGVGVGDRFNGAATLSLRK